MDGGIHVDVNERGTANRERALDGVGQLQRVVDAFAVRAKRARGCRPEQWAAVRARET